MLVLLDLDGKFLWETNAIGVNCRAQLQDTKNLVLKDHQLILIVEFRLTNR